MRPKFDFQLSQPSGFLSSFVQALWSVSASDDNTEEIIKPLYSDAGSGFLFNLSTPIILDGSEFESGVVVLPIKKHASSITLPPGAVATGIRFHPAVGYGVLGRHYEQAMFIDGTDQIHLELEALFGQLKPKLDNAARIQLLHSWLGQHMDFSNVIPDSLEIALEDIQSDCQLGELSNNNLLGQRQIERQFQQWLGMTAKHYQRILRIKKTINFMYENPKVDLVDVAMQFGFSDQSHMTREFKNIAHTTPAQLRGLQ
jgi:AraC-like DNA-binding protein